MRSDQVEIFKRGDEIVLRETSVKLSELLSRLPPLPAGALPDEIPDNPPDPIEPE